MAINAKRKKAIRIIIGIALICFLLLGFLAACYIYVTKAKSHTVAEYTSENENDSLVIE